MIIKVQVSLATTHSVAQVLVYNKDRSVEWTGDMTDVVEELMAGRLKAFFTAEIDSTTKMIDIKEEALWQDW